MDVKEAVQKASDYIHEVYTEEDVQHVALEEVVFDDKEAVWKVTIGFFRPWNQRTGIGAALTEAYWKSRSFKVVQIDDSTGHVQSMTHRDLPILD